ncbi:MAG: hypothetical protein QXQ68_05975 [Candidatus Nitrosocaldaceae archaeon]
MEEVKKEKKGRRKRKREEEEEEEEETWIDVFSRLFMKEALRERN